MIKTTCLIFATIFGVVSTGAQVTEPKTATAEQTKLPLPQAESVIAQFSYLELVHDERGFHFSVTDKTGVFINLEFPGNLHVRIGF